MSKLIIKYKNIFRILIIFYNKKLILILRLTYRVEYSICNSLRYGVRFL